MFKTNSIFNITLVALITISFILPEGLSGQELKYQFEAGQVLEFKRTGLTTGSTSKFPFISKKKTDVYQFKIDSILHDTFKMTMIHKLQYYNKVSQSLSSGTSFQIISPYSDREFVKPLMNWIGLKMEIKFKVSNTGIVSNIEGNEKILDKYIQTIHNDPRLTEYISFEQATTSFSDNYYSALINEFFPVLISPYQQKFDVDILALELQTKHEILERKSNNLSVSIVKFTELFGPNQPHGQTMPYNDSYISGTWNLSKHFFQNLSSSELPTKDKISQMASLAQLPWNWYTANINNMQFQKIHIEVIKDHIESNIPAVIKGNIYGGKDEYFYTYLPAEIAVLDVLSKKMIDDTTSIDISIDLKNGPIILNSYIWNTKETYSPSLIMEGALNLYLEPGDTVFFEWDLNQSPAAISLCGSKMAEQEFLKTFHYPMPFPGTHSDETLLFKNEELLSGNNDSISTFLLGLLKEEQIYFNLLREIETLKELKTLQPNSFKDRIIKILPFLGNEVYQNSEAYKLFVENFFKLVKPNFKTEQLWNSPIDEEYHFAGQYLAGWDRYWYLARLVETSLASYPIPKINTRLNKFVQQFPNTDLAIKLQKKADDLEYGKIGAEFPQLDLYNYKGKHIKSKKFANSNLMVFQFNVHLNKPFVGWSNATVQKINTRKFEPQRRTVEQEITQLQRLQEKSKQRISFLILMDKPNDSLINALESKIGSNSMEIICRDKNEDFFVMFENLRQKHILYNYEGKMVRNKDGWDGDLYTYLSWPLIPEKTNEKIDLNLMLIIVGVLVAVAILGFLLLRLLMRRKQKKTELKRKITELELNAVRARMNPHFLFNALNSIQLLINSGNTNKANTYLAKFAHLIRSTLNQSSRTAISLQEEIDALKTYIQLEQLRFPFKESIEIDSNLDPDRLEVPPLLIQPHVENSIWHGISDLGSKGLISIKITKIDNNLVIIVEDNGPGINPDRDSSNGLGQGWKITNQRVELLKDQWGDQLMVEIIDSDESKGMIVKFTIPIETKMA